ncbi:hypothetical protein ACFRQM_11685 [Streptomyces sp. NPDC056831]|uniref:hypothetical protein n=1 Tax=Streptomyces sp. NPDC056831 TaxID=3345954 RepID=UPI0036883901
MLDSGIQDWRITLQSCGLVILEGKAPSSAPSPLVAIRAVTGVDVRPKVAIQESRPDAIEEIDRQWQAQVSKTTLVSETGKFLILPPVSGGSAVGWVRVKDSIGFNLPSRIASHRIASVTGSAEFPTLSADGHHLHAVSVEDDEYWIVVRTFTR